MSSSPLRSRASASLRLNFGPCSSDDSGLCFIRTCRPTRTFSSAVIDGNSRMFWKVRAMPFSVTDAGSWGSRSPRSDTEPDVGAYRPVRQLNSVVLPAPFGPIRPMI